MQQMYSNNDANDSGVFAAAATISALALGIGAAGFGIKKGAGALKNKFTKKTVNLNGRNINLKPPTRFQKLSKNNDVGRLAPDGRVYMRTAPVAEDGKILTKLRQSEGKLSGGTGTSSDLANMTERQKRIYGDQVPKPKDFVDPYKSHVTQNPQPSVSNSIPTNVATTGHMSEGGATINARKNSPVTTGHMSKAGAKRQAQREANKTKRLR